MGGEAGGSRCEECVGHERGLEYSHLAEVSKLRRSLPEWLLVRACAGRQRILLCVGARDASRVLYAL